jgi:glycopeptide antibiotics resistance protein
LQQLVPVFIGGCIVVFELYKVFNSSKKKKTVVAVVGGGVYGLVVLSIIGFLIFWQREGVKDSGFSDGTCYGPAG